MCGKVFAVHIVSKYVSKLTQILKLENFLIQQMQMLEKEKTKIKDTKNKMNMRIVLL